jgi:hypothetical protein
VSSGDLDGFEELFEYAEPRLRHAFTGLHRPDVGVDAAAEARAWAVEHWDKVRVSITRSATLAVSDFPLADPGPIVLVASDRVSLPK